jgi:hypothetical protein
MRAAAEVTLLTELERLVAAAGPLAEHRVLCEIDSDGRRFPVHVLAFGNRDPAVPGVGFFGGVHGLERVGSHVVLTHLQSLVTQLHWDRVLQRQLETLRMVFMPIVNPAGMARGTRANANGVDLMRNAPVDARERALFLVGGQRVSAGLPWYRGAPGAAMEAEAAALCQVVREELLARPFSIAIDCHSGFGLQDRIWFPYAHTRAPFAHLAEMFCLKVLFEAAHAHHTYVFEPQSRQYLAHGDLWDHLHLQAAAQPGCVFLPLTLEMGSWIWVKKNPRQLLSRHGLFNPLIAHRLQRVLRRHMAWLEFVARSACSYREWLPVGEARGMRERQALDEWYAGAALAADAAAPGPDRP